MNLRYTIDAKDFFTRPDGEIVVDLTQGNYNPNNSSVFIEYGVITEDFVMRPDLLGKLFYSDPGSYELILKQNGISNPFSIDEGDVLFIQDRRAITNQFSTSGGPKSNSDIVRNQYLDPSKAPAPDENLKKFDIRKKFGLNTTKDAESNNTGLPPNFANFGDSEIKFRNGKVIFGEDVSSNIEVCDTNPISKSEFLNRLLKNRLNNNR